MTGFKFSDKPPAEVSGYFREKGDRPAFRWSEVWGEEHAQAFTVAKATQLDVLGAIRSSLQTAIDQGVPYEAWARDLKPELERLGWWGVKEMADPATGELKPAQLGSPRRLAKIYQSNLRSARAAGQWERAQRTKAVLPFFVYQLGPSARHRPEHIAKEGVIRPVDDSFWDAWFPPNGWGCKCWVRQIAGAEATRLGGETPAFTVPEASFSRVRDDGSVERVKVPKGIDPGWQTNAGRNRSRTLMDGLAAKLEAAGEPVARAAVADFWKGSTPEALAKLGSRAFAPVAIAPKAVRDELASEAHLVKVASDVLAAKVDKHGLGGRALKPADFGKVQAILDRGELVERAGSNASYVLKLEDGWWQAVVKSTAAGELIVSSLYPVSERRVDRLRRR
jgi:hypothetical protein